MTQTKINRAYLALGNVVNFDLPMKKAYGIFKLYKALEEQFDFSVSEEKKYISSLGGSIDLTGKIYFDSEEQWVKYREKMAELGDMDVEVKYEPVTLTEVDLGTQKVKPSDIFALDGFVTFSIGKAASAKDKK